MTIGHCKLQPHRLDFALAKCVDGDGSRDELLKVVSEYE